MKVTVWKTAYIVIACLLTAINTAFAQPQTQPYECKIDSIEVFGKKLLCVSMTGYEGIAEGMYRDYTCKLSLAWFGMPALGGVPVHLLQFDIRPNEGIEPIAQKRSNLGLVAFRDNGKAFYDIGNERCTVYPEGLRAQYLIGEEMGCIDLFKEKDMARLTVVDSAYNIVRDLEFKSFRSANTIVYMDSILQEIGQMTQPLDYEVPFVENPTARPQYPGGDQAFKLFLARNIVIPEHMENPDTEGGVRINFVVNEDGSLSDFKVAEPVDPALDAEALRVAKLMPRWTPANLYGKPLKMKASIRVSFVTEPAYYPETKSFRMFTTKYPSTWYWAFEEKGAIRISFVVNEDGSLSDFKVKDSVDPELDAEIMRMAKLMHSWIPAKFNGKPVKSIQIFYFPVDIF